MGRTQLDLDTRGVRSLERLFPSRKSTTPEFNETQRYKKATAMVFTLRFSADTPRSPFCDEGGSFSIF